MMKKTLLTRLYALSLSAVFACVATAGVAVIMSASAARGQPEFAAAAAQPSAPSLTQLKASTATSSGRSL